MTASPFPVMRLAFSAGPLAAMTSIAVVWDSNDSESVPMPRKTCMIEHLIGKILKSEKDQHSSAVSAAIEMRNDPTEHTHLAMCLDMLALAE